MSSSYEIKVKVVLEVTARAADDEMASVMLRRLVKGIDWKTYKAEFEKQLEEQPEDIEVSVRKVCE